MCDFCSGTLSGTARAAKLDDDESDEDNDSSKVSHARSLKRGTAVVIQCTENTQQRAPHLIGRVGTIKEVPQHPNTWFKVQFADRRVCTFRPSALRRANHIAAGSTAAWGGGDDAASSSARPRSTMAAAAKPAKGEEEPAAAKEKRTSAKERASKLLSNVVDAERWVGLYVRIRVGRLSGVIGRILRSGNGWVQLRTERGEIAKRAYELELVGEREALPDLREPDAQAAKVAREKLQHAAAAKATRQSTRSVTTGDHSSQEDGDVTTTPPMSPPSSNSPPLNLTQLTATGQPMTRAAAKESSMSITPPPGGILTNDQARPQLLSPSSRGRGTSSTAKQAAYRDAVRKHLERNREKYKERPNLAEWLAVVQGGAWDCDASTGGAYLGAYPVDEAAEDDDHDEHSLLVAPRWLRRATTRDALAGNSQKKVTLSRPGCALCRTEKDQNGACWNPRCVASPAFSSSFSTGGADDDDDDNDAPQAAAKALATRPAKRLKRSSADEKLLLAKKTAPRPETVNSVSRKPIPCDILTYCGSATVHLLGKARQPAETISAANPPYDPVPHATSDAQKYHAD